MRNWKMSSFFTLGSLRKVEMSTDAALDQHRWVYLMRQWTRSVSIENKEVFPSTFKRKKKAKFYKIFIAMDR